ncbi:MAG: L,D-transpeptidase family protein [Betaproteobacteria bacterium]
MDYLRRAAGLLVIVLSVACREAGGQPTRIATPDARLIADAAALINRTFAAPSGPGTSSSEYQNLQRLYSNANGSPRWVDAAGRPTLVAREALDLLCSAETDGLDPDDYDASRTVERAAALEGSPSPSDVAAFDVALSLGTLRYLHDLHAGRIDPATLGIRLERPTDHPDYVALLEGALARGRIAPEAAELTPPSIQYRALRELLARYRALASNPTLKPPPLPAEPLRPGDAFKGLPALQRLLAAFGDLPVDAAASAVPETYEGALVEAVRHFQRRHGLTADGVVGRATARALAVPPSARVNQIELSLERLRWLPRLAGRRLIAINIPMFRLWAWDANPPAGAPTLGMGVIVGRALDTQTPMLIEEMRSVLFRPAWNVPLSITQKEIVPRLGRDPGYLAREDMELVAGPGDGAPVVPATPENLMQLKHGALRVRQRPGPKNSLGLVKFDFPNDESVYMHGTPARELFSRARRDFSHGCVRVEDPVALAVWVLGGPPAWSREDVLDAMHAEGSHRVELARPLQVVLFYMTALVSPEEGTAWFADDIYRQDARLDAALAAESHQRRTRPVSTWTKFDAG